MAKQSLSKSPSKPVEKSTPKLSPETAETIARAQKGVERFSRMAHGVQCFCFNVDEGREDVYEFSTAIATIADMMQEDAALIAKILAEVREGGAE